MRLHLRASDPMWGDAATLLVTSWGREVKAFQI